MPGTGKITQVIGSTFDVESPEDQLPAIYNAVTINHQEDGSSISLVGEIASHLGGGKVRAVALGSTDGLRRGIDCVDTGSPVTPPCGGGSPAWPPARGSPCGWGRKRSAGCSPCWASRSTSAGPSRSASAAR